MSAATKTNAAKPPALKPIPFKPRRGLFVAMLIANVLWIGALVWMYFATVRNAPNPRAMNEANDVQTELQRELDELNATTRPGADGSPSAPR